MDTKLTLIIEKDIVSQAKSYARTEKRSLSDLVENYLKTLVTPDSIITDEITPIVKSLKGSVKVYHDFDYKSELKNVLSDKYVK